MARGPADYAGISKPKWDDRTGPDGTGVDWTGLHDCLRLDAIERAWTGVNGMGMNCMGLDGAERDRMRLGGVGLDLMGFDGAAGFKGT